MHEVVRGGSDSSGATDLGSGRRGRPGLLRRPRGRPGSVTVVPDDRPMQERIRAALTAAMRDQDKVAMSAYRTALAALDNAEAVDSSSLPRPPVGETAIAGAAVGAFATEVPRRSLTSAEQRAVVLAEVVERRRLADDFAGAGRPADANRLWAEADLLQALLAN